MRERLGAALARLGWPGLADPAAPVRPFSLTRRYANHRVLLEDGSSRLLRVARSPRSWEGLQHELAAHTALQTTRLPVVSEMVLLDDEAPRATLSSWMPGLSGRGVVDAHPDALPQMCMQLGQLRRALAEQTGGAFAMGVVEGRFRSIRRTWRDEYLTCAWDWFTTAERVGASLGPVSRAVMARIEALSPALDAAAAPVLIHGDLRPANLMFEVGVPPGKDQPPPVAVVGVVDWELAVVGDPLLAFALPMELPDEALAWVVQGYGQHDARQWVADDAARDRLAVYGLGRVLQYLAVAVRAQIEDGGERAGLGLAHASALAAERLRPTWVRERLQAALPEAAPESVPLPRPIDRVRGLLRGAFARFACRPALGPAAVEPWVGAVGASLRDRGHEAEGWVRDGELSWAAIEPPAEPRSGQPIADRAAWAIAIDRAVRSAPAAGMATVVWWLALEALERLTAATGPDGWPVSDAELRGLQSFLHVVGRGAPPPDVRGRLLASTLALAAERRIPSLLGVDPADERADDLLDRVAESWEDLTVFGGEQPEALEPAALAERVAGDGAWAVPLVLLATEVLDDLPIPKRALIGALCGSFAASG
jgi:aminoglycoside phosphotransferase (APT) family kinase protein